MPFLAQAQEILGDANYRGIYEFRFKTTENQTDFSRPDLMYLDIGENVSAFYSRNNWLRDSVVRNSVSLNLSIGELANRRSQFQRGTTTMYYTLHNDASRLVVEGYALFSYYNEPLQMPQWIIKDEILVVTGYHCKKAVANYLGRKWSVFFAPDIPINEGPWKLWGLPGMIVYATDSDRYFEFQLISFEELKKPAFISVFLEDSEKKPYANRTKKEFRRYEKLYYEEPMSFFRLAYGVLSISSSRTPQKNPHIPLEPW